ncbi:MAG TPA: ASPIC/UnbV domain-containing protein, partial [Gemmatimonadaceae bacterium]|nr:ASPIC/UnbV domain-containing protein [Gemmatimonadaceae bacterium]
NDGDVDVFIVNHGGPGILLRNDGGNRNHWLQVELHGTKSNRQGIGAKVRLVAGGAAQVRQIGAQSPYLSQNSLVETFGLGAVTRVDSVVVAWPSGMRQVRTGIAANQRLAITEGDAGGSDRDRVQAFWDVYRQATAQRVAGQIQLATETYSRALELQPDHEDALYYYGSMRYVQGEFAEAATAWRHLVTLDPRSGKTHSQLGALFMCLEDAAPYNLDSAEVHLRLADQINREQTAPRLHLGETALIRGDAAAARKYFDEVLRTNGQSQPALLYTGYLAWKSGDAARARANFEKAAAAPPPSAALPGGASNEGDTKSGAALAQQHARCDDLHAASVPDRDADANRAMTASYRRLDKLLARYRARRRG